MKRKYKSLSNMTRNPVRLARALEEEAKAITGSSDQYYVICLGISLMSKIFDLNQEAMSYLCDLVEKDPFILERIHQVDQSSLANIMNAYAFGEEDLETFLRAK